MNRCRRQHLIGCGVLLLAILGLLKWDTFAAGPTSDQASGDAANSPAPTAPKRLVILKFDGLMPSLLDEYGDKINPRTGRSYLPWVKHVFYDQGVRVRHFYTRGLSLSGSSWSLIDTGQHMAVKGNVEFDRATGHADDYLNFLRFYVETINDRHVYPRPVEVLDEAGVRLLSDAFSNEEKFAGWQLIRRGAYWKLMAEWLKRKYVSAPVDEWIKRFVIGFDGAADGVDVNLTKLLETIPDPQVHYLDFYSPLFDKVTHGTNDTTLLLKSLQQVDSIVGQVYSAIQQSSRAKETILVILSDHGSNTDPRVASQGFNLARFFSAAEHGGHHVFTKRVVMARYQWKPNNPLSPSYVTESRDAFYLKGKKKYVTAILDFDGNEQSMLHLRNSDLNKLHILFLELKKSPPERIERALRDAFFEIVDRWRERWQRECEELKEEFYALDVQRQEYERRLDQLQTDPSRETLRRIGFPSLRSEDLSFEVRQRRLELKALAGNLAEYRRQYEDTYQMYSLLLGLKKETFDARSLQEERLILPGVMGPLNRVYDLQNYVVGFDKAVLSSDGKLDEKSFRTVDYLALLRGFRVSNNYQPGISPAPIDFLATRIPYTEIAPALRGTEFDTGHDVVWLYRDQEKQALILTERSPTGEKLLRYLPVAELQQTAAGEIRFRQIPFQPGLPLALWEDEQFHPGSSDKERWLSQFHPEKAWRAATHLTKYSLGVTGLGEEFGHEYVRYYTSVAADSPADRLLKRFYQRRKENTEADLLLHASDHWNFDMKDFNPGGNHGSFFRLSMHSVFMLWGGTEAGLKRGAVVDTPYDGLSCAPTLLEAAELLRKGRLTPRLEQRGFRPFPGEIIWEIFDPEGLRHASADPRQTQDDGAKLYE